MTAIKICGLMTEGDCMLSVAAGATMLGFNFWPKSKRYISPKVAVELASQLPKSITKVGLFVDAKAEWVQEVHKTVKLDLLQFHGDETPKYCRQFNAPFMKAFRLRGTETIERVRDYVDSPRHPFLVDAYVPGQQGGTGHRIDLELALRARECTGHMILAGGLTPSNVQAAIEAIGPWGVDVASGVEHAPGQKDPSLVQAFTQAVHEARIQ